MGGRLLYGAAKGLKRSNSAQSVRLAHNKQLTECNCANPYVAVITREINGFLPFRADPTAACQRPPATQKDLARGRAGAAGCWALRGDPGWQGGPCAGLTNPFHLPAFPYGLPGSDLASQGQFVHGPPCPCPPHCAFLPLSPI